MDIAITAFTFIVLIFSAVIHEVAHGLEAQHLGDDTAEKAGRLTLNPLKHLDPYLSLLMPLILWFATGFFFAGAKPVPYNPNNLKNLRIDSVKVAFAGPITNLIIAIVFGGLAIALPVAINEKHMIWNAVAGGVTGIPTFSTALAAIYFLFLLIAYINVLLGIFNLVPIPPLDGSKILLLIIPRNERSYKFFYFWERWGLILVLIFVFVFYGIITAPINGLFSAFTGHALGL